MRQRDDFPEPAPFVVQGFEEFVVLAFSEAEQEIPPAAEGQLDIEIFDDAGADYLFQRLIVVVIVVFPVFGKTERTGGGDVEILVKSLRSAHRIDPAVDEVGAQLRPGSERVVDAAFLAQHPGAGEGYAGNAGAKTTGVDAGDEDALPVIVEVFLVEGGHAGAGIRAVEGIDQVYTCGELPIGLEGLEVVIED